jgi:flavin-dependent dehydrogenase
MYDVVVVGGRLAGAATAAHLSKQGRSVLLLEKDTFPKDVLSTHFMWPRGASYLARLGVLDRVVPVAPFFEEVDLVIEGVSIRSGVAEEDLRNRFRSLHGDDKDVVNASFSARRDLLDDLLLAYAAECGVEVRQGARMTELVEEDGRVVGVRWRSSPDGPETTERARIVVGADGRRSHVARLAGAAPQGRAAERILRLLHIPRQPPSEGSHAPAPGASRYGFKPDQRRPDDGVGLRPQ